MTNNSGNTKTEVTEGVGSRNESWKRNSCSKGRLSREVRGYNNQFAEAKHLEYKSWVDHEVFDLGDPRKIKPRIYETRRWVLIIKTDKQGNFLKTKATWALRGFQDKQREYQDPAFG